MTKQTHTTGHTGALYLYARGETPQDQLGVQFRGVRIYYNAAQARAKDGKWTSGGDLKGDDHLKAAEHLRKQAGAIKDPAKKGGFDALSRAHDLLGHLKHAATAIAAPLAKRIGQHLKMAEDSGVAAKDGNTNALLQQGKEALAAEEHKAGAGARMRQAVAAAGAKGQAHLDKADAFSAKRGEARKAKQFSVAARHHADQLAHTAAHALVTGQDAAPHLENMGKAVKALRVQAYHSRKKGNEQDAFMRQHAATHYAKMHSQLKAAAKTGKPVGTLKSYGKDHMAEGMAAFQKQQQDRAEHTATAKAYRSQAHVAGKYGKDFGRLAQVHEALSVGDTRGAMKAYDMSRQNSPEQPKTKAEKVTHGDLLGAYKGLPGMMAKYSPEVAHDQANTGNQELDHVHGLIAQGMKYQRQGGTDQGVDGITASAGKRLRDLRKGGTLTPEQEVSADHAAAGLKAVKGRQAYANKSTLEKANAIPSSALADFHEGLQASSGADEATPAEHSVTKGHEYMALAHGMEDPAKAKEMLDIAKGHFAAAAGGKLSPLHKKLLRLGNTSAKVLQTQLGGKTAAQEGQEGASEPQGGTPVPPAAAAKPAAPMSLEEGHNATEAALHNSGTEDPGYDSLDNLTKAGIGAKFLQNPKVKPGEYGGVIKNLAGHVAGVNPDELPDHLKGHYANVKAASEAATAKYKAEAPQGHKNAGREGFHKDQMNMLLGKKDQADPKYGEKIGHLYQAHKYIAQAANAEAAGKGDTAPAMLQTAQYHINKVKKLKPEDQHFEENASAGIAKIEDKLAAAKSQMAASKPAAEPVVKTPPNVAGPGIGANGKPMNPNMAKLYTKMGEVKKVTKASTAPGAKHLWDAAHSLQKAAFSGQTSPQTTFHLGHAGQHLKAAAKAGAADGPLKNGLKALYAIHQASKGAKVPEVEDALSGKA